jgi:hypothetical protein
MEIRCPLTPRIDDFPFELRCKLIAEESAEFTEACGFPMTAQPWLHSVRPARDPDWPEMIDALCDIIYVTMGAACAMGIDLDPFFDEVHRSNMAKVGGPVRDDGKRLKPAGWTPPDIAGVLARVIAGQQEEIDRVRRRLGVIAHDDRPEWDCQSDLDRERASLISRLKALGASGAPASLEKEVEHAASPVSGESWPRGQEAV